MILRTAATGHIKTRIEYDYISSHPNSTHLSKELFQRIVFLENHEVFAYISVDFLDILVP
jgi:hypothetical protein